MTRFLLTVGVIVVIALVLGGMRWGWVRRGARQSALAPLPELTPELAERFAAAPAIEVLSLGSTTAGNWLDRVVAHDLGIRAAAGLVVLEDAGVLLDRDGAPPVFIPRDALRGVRLDRGIAGKAFEKGGIVVITWILGDGAAATAIDTGVRARATMDHVAVVESIRRMLSDAGHEEITR